MKKILCVIAFGLMLFVTDAQDLNKKVVNEKPSLKAEVKKALVVVDKQVVALDKQVVLETKYKVDDVEMSSKSQAKDNAVREVCVKNNVSVILEPKIKVSKKKGYYYVKITGTPARVISLKDSMPNRTFKILGEKKKTPKMLEGGLENSKKKQ